MQLAGKFTVLGNFNNVTLTHFGVTSAFYRNGDKFMVRTEGPNGKLRNYEIKYTFGVDPLQQYLVEFPGGRLQVLGMAWDTRKKELGGQRWFYLYPDEKISYNDALHWSKPGHNWNSMCAECHSTNIKKNYNSATKTFSTTWSEMDVSCEACHGPGSDHVRWARHKPGWEKLQADKGLTLSLDERKGIHWRINPKTGNAIRNRARHSEKEIEMCARCHSRRTPITGKYVFGEPFMNHYLPRLLDEGMYYPDGQIRDEVYVYGSFLQSKMFHAGVTCSDCHEPHSLALRVPGNGVCLQCHQAVKYDQSSHHFHNPGSAGSRCVECHMLSRAYMVVDRRRDHSIRIPRPDLSVKLETPNPCNNCHQDKGPEWAAAQLKTWYGHTPAGFQTYAKTLHVARQKTPGAGTALEALIRNMDTPDIARATAFSLIKPYLGPARTDVLSLGLADDNPMVRESAVSALEAAPQSIRARLATPMLSDPVRAVRIAAVQILVTIPTDELTTAQRILLGKGLQEYIAAQQASAEQPQAQINLGNLYTDLGEIERAAKAYKAAIDINQGYVPGYVNLADLYRRQGNETRAEDILRKGVEVIKGSAAIHHALGLSLVRQKRADEAVEEFRLAYTLDPDNANYSYVYAVALNSTGNPGKAVVILRDAHNAHPDNVYILSALVAFYRDMGNQAAARRYADKLRAILP